MTNGRDDGNRRVTNRARDYFFIKSPEILNRSAASSDNHHVDRLVVSAGTQRAFVMFVKKFDRPDDFILGVFALHARRRQQDVHRARASLQHVENVANRRAIRGSNHPDAARKHRNCALQLCGEQSFGLQTGFRLLERQLQRAGPNRFERIGYQLVLALRLVHAQTAAGAHLHSILRAKANPLIAAAITGRAHLREFILQGEVPMTGVVRAKVRDLAFDPHAHEAILERRANLRRQFRDADGPSLSFVEEGCE